MRAVISALALVFVAGAVIWGLAPADDGADQQMQRLTPSVHQDPPPVDVTVRGELASPAGIHATLHSSRAGTMAVELSRGMRLVAQLRRDVRAGRTRIVLGDDLRDGWYVLFAGIRTPEGASDGQSKRLYVTERLSTRAAIRLMGGRDQFADESLSVMLSGRCRSFGANRIDCESRIYRSDIGNGDYERCFEIVSVLRAPSGAIKKRTYRCARPLFRRAPHWRDQERVAP